jgi:hypothetical protein
MTSCSSLYKSGTRYDGVYTINPDGLGSFQVRCDMQTDGGGWTVFQRRQDASVDFYRGWQDYKNGFGDLNGNFWLGLDEIHRLTKSGQNFLRVDLMDWTNETAYAKYGSFSVASESDGYRLDLGSFSGKYATLYYMSKFLNTSEFINMINSRHILNLSIELIIKAQALLIRQDFYYKKRGGWSAWSRRDGGIFKIFKKKF